MIDTIGNAELKNKEEDLLKNMKMLRNCVADMFGSKSFFKGLIHEPQNGIITVNGEQFPVYISANTLSVDSHPDITEDIFDTENYLSLLTDDDLMWYALVEHLAHQVELLQEDNNKYSDELVKANEEIDNLNCKVAEEIKARRGYEESLNQLREELTAADNEIEGLEESLREANKKCTEYVNDIGKLETDNNRLSERVRTLVCEKCNGKDLPLKFGEQERLGSKQANEIIEDEASKEVVNMDMEMAIMHQNNLALHTKVTLLTSSLDTAQKENNDLRKRIAEYAQKNGDLLERNKRLNQEITKLRAQFNSYSGASVVDHDDMQQTITKEAMAELTARINELESTLKDKDERINQLSKNNAALSTENKNFGDLLKEADRTARFYAREVDNLEKEIKDLKLEAANDEDCDSVLEPHEVTANDGMNYTVSLETMNQLTARIKELESINENLREEIEKIKHENEDFERVAAAHLDTTAKFAEYKDKQKRLYKHFKNLAEMIEDLMELG